MDGFRVPNHERALLQVDTQKFVGVIQRLSLTGGSAILSKGLIPRGTVARMGLRPYLDRSLRNPILARAAIDVWTKLGDLSNQRTADLIKELAALNPPAGSNARKVADLFNSYMNEAGIEAKGLAPIRPHMDAIAAIHDKKELARVLGETLRADVDALNNTNFYTPNLFGLWVAPGLQRLGPLHTLPDAGRHPVAGSRVLPFG